MKSITIISFLLLVGGNGFGQVHFVDTNKVAVVSFNTSRHKVERDYPVVKLTTKEIRQVDSLVSIRIAQNSQKVLDSIYGKDEMGVGRHSIRETPYFKQFSALLNDKEEKVVYVFCFCKYYENSDRWKETMYKVADGGNCFFYVMVNLSTLSYYDLIINGPHLVKYKEK